MFDTTTTFKSGSITYRFNPLEMKYEATISGTTVEFLEEEDLYTLFSKVHRLVEDRRLVLISTRKFVQSMDHGLRALAQQRRSFIVKVKPTFKKLQAAPAGPSHLPAKTKKPASKKK